MTTMKDDELRRHLGQLFVVGFSGLTVTEDIRTLIRAPYYCGSVILFQRNIKSAEQVILLINELQRIAKEAGHTRPLFISCDQENGVVTRIKPPLAAQLPGAMALGATRSTDDAFRVFYATGELLGSLGFNMNFAPLCDVNSEPANPVIGVRSPSDDGVLVGKMASAMAKGLRARRIVPCIKHFPGHGDTKIDSHFGAPVVSKSKDELEDCELIPFRRLVAEGIEAVMTSHVVMSAFDDSGLPASCDRHVINALRRELQYEGLVITDCLEMDAIRVPVGTDKGAAAALGAGADCVVVSHTFELQVRCFEEAFTACKLAVIPLTQIQQSVARVFALKDKFLRWETALRRPYARLIPEMYAKHRELAKEVYSRSVTVIRDDQHALPLKRTGSLVFAYPCGKATRIGADGESMKYLHYLPTEFSKILKSYVPDLIECPFFDDATLDDTVKAIIPQVDAVILASRDCRLNPSQKLVGTQLATTTKKLISVATCVPYDFISSNIKTCIAMYEPTPEAFRAAVEVIFGVSVGVGSLPVCLKRPPAPIEDFEPEEDLKPLMALWHSVLPGYQVPPTRLANLLCRPNGKHFTAKVKDELVGFVATYTDEERSTAYISAIVVAPALQSQGIGTSLIHHARHWLKAQRGARAITIGSSIPRFFLGVPLDIPRPIQDFFTHRGFVPISGPNSRDYTVNLRSYKVPAGLLQRTDAVGVRFTQWRPDMYEESISRIKEFRGEDGVWVGAYERIAQEGRFEQVMVAIDRLGKQIGWTLMQEYGIGMTNDLAFMGILGENTGQIGCVGVHPTARDNGVGIALIAVAALDLKRRGMERVFVDWTNHVNFYEKAGFEIWKEYRQVSLKEIV